jgi:flagellar FliJ protein
MKKFRFRLETLLKVRTLREQEAMRLLAEAQRRYQAELAEKARLQAELERAFQGREALGGGAASTSTDFKLAHEFIVGGKHRLVRQEQAIFRAQKGIEKALRAYLQARRQTRAIELLREKDYAEFKRARAKQEQKVIDELSSVRHAREFWAHEHVG